MSDATTYISFFVLLNSSKTLAKLAMVQNTKSVIVYICLLTVALNNYLSDRIH